jgi:PKD repeat protein
MKETELRMLVRHIIKEAIKMIDETSSTGSVGGAVDIPAAFSNTGKTNIKKKKKSLLTKKKKFIPDTTFEPYAKPKTDKKRKTLTEEETIDRNKLVKAIEAWDKNKWPDENEWAKEVADFALKYMKKK